MITNFAKRNPRRFWKWFSLHEKEFREINKDNYQKVFYKIFKCLEKFNPYLGFEIVNNSSDGKKEFIVTANGNTDLFETVYSLINAAPQQLKDRWNFTALRQATAQEVIIHFDDKTISSKDIFYELEESENDPGKLDIFIHIKGVVYSSEDVEDFIAESMIAVLDGLIGEYTNATKISTLILVENGELEEPKNILKLRKEINEFGAN